MIKTFLANCYVLAKGKRITQSDGQPAVVTREISARNKNEATKAIKELCEYRNLEFIDWWEEWN
jgi:hypothetical protein